jgi:hypothetical protein
MRYFIIVHDETVELAFKQFHLGLSYGSRSFMSHPKSVQHILGHIQAINSIKLFFVD